GPWRQKIQWENNGRVYSLLSTGSEYHPAGLSTVRRRGSQIYLSTNREAGATNGEPPFNSHALNSGSGPRGARAGVSGRGSPDVDSITLAGEDQLPPSAVLDHPGRAGGDGALSGSEEPRRPEDMASDDPRNPYKNSRNTVLYNIYSSAPAGGRTRTRARRPPETGFGTRNFQNGKRFLHLETSSLQPAGRPNRMKSEPRRCAAEENCLARSAYRPGVRDIHYRVLLRFPQRVKNQGTADFLPVKPRHQWEWHSCHQHYHSMDAFSNYDLLDVSTGRKVAEGHKASFCLEDTSCDPGFRRRYACTAHTQGLGPGCYDTYNANIDCQWIDITDVPPGNYVLKVTVNPNFQVQETDFSNNVVRCDITYTGSYVSTRNCRITGY
uniref:Lysyl oxidase homolog n=1 Tax=Lepisosteus oculatus TaxID=7918 RepID=W5M8Q8_LEPOC